MCVVMFATQRVKSGSSKQSVQDGAADKKWFRLKTAHRGIDETIIIITIMGLGINRQ